MQVELCVGRLTIFAIWCMEEAYAWATDSPFSHNIHRLEVVSAFDSRDAGLAFLSSAG